MSLMNCTFTVRWSDEKNELHKEKPTLPKMVLSERAMAAGHGVRSVDIAVKIIISQLVVWKTEISRPTEAEQKAILRGGEQYRFNQAADCCI